jgi:hypothetical protein
MIDTKIKKGAIIVLGITFVVILLARMGFFSTVLIVMKVPPRSCCSCVCESEEGDWCSGLIKGSYIFKSCDYVCREACQKKGCLLGKVDFLSEKRCLGFFPFF